MFKRPSVHYGRTPEAITPYQRAAQVWDDRIGSARVQARNWRLMAFGCLLLSGGLAASPRLAIHPGYHHAVGGGKLIISARLSRSRRRVPSTSRVASSIL